MKKFNILKKILLLILAFSINMPCFAGNTPKLGSYVNDHARVLSSQTRNLLEQKLWALDKQDSTQVVVLTVSSLNEVALEDYAIRVFNQNGIGRKDKDNGVLFLMALQEREVRIEVGKGVEHVLTDTLAGRIIDDDVTPHFKQGDFNAGFVAGVKKIEKVVKGTYKKDVRGFNPVLKTILDFAGAMCFFIWVLCPVPIISTGSKTVKFLCAVAPSVLCIVFLFFYMGMPLKQILLLGAFWNVVHFIFRVLEKYAGESSGGGRRTCGGGFSGGGGRSGGGGASGRF